MVKIVDLPESNPLLGAEVLPISQSGSTVKATVEVLTDYLLTRFNTDDVIEGSTNLFFTSARATAVFSPLLSAHTGNTSNPHNTTKTHVGLGNVENTALSTWAGTSNITTLGTVATGTWNATAIALGKVGNFATGTLLGRSTAGTGSAEAITVGSQLSLSGGTLSVTTTKANVGLGNVENTALSTWAGTSNITTVGTITTGIWNATKLTLAKLPSITANRLLGRSTAGTGDAEELTLGAGLTITGGSLTLSGTIGLVPKGYISGPSPRYASAATITIPTGLVALDTTGTQMIEVTSDLTPSLAVSGVANGLDTGSEASGTFYYVWLIRKSSDGTVASLFSTSTTSPTMPTGYDQRALLRAFVRNDASSNILPFFISGVGAGARYRYNVRFTNQNTSTVGTTNFVASASAGFVTTTVSLIPSALSRTAILRFSSSTSGSIGTYRTDSTLDNQEVWQATGNSPYTVDVYLNASNQFDHQRTSGTTWIDVAGCVIDLI